MARTRTSKARDPYTDGSVVQPILDVSENTWASLSSDIGSTGLRQYSGYVREEFLSQLRGRELSKTYREMIDNQAVVGSIMFAIVQAMRSVRWRDVPANDSAEATRWAEWAGTLRHDCSHTWEEHVTEALSMIGYGFSLHELVYKRRNGRKRQSENVASSRYNDGLIGWRRLPGRSQDTILHWFFDKNGQITGVQQLPWVGRLIDIPVEKLLLFRPAHFKGNPEGRSILRNSVRSHHFIKRLEEMESVLFERLSGLPIMYIPGKTIAAASTGDKEAVAAYSMYKKLVNNVRINEQMGMVLPSDMWPGPNGPSTQPMFKFDLATPQAGHVVDPGALIQRYKLDILKSVLADFIDLGHQARGTQNLAITKIDMFYQGIEGWLHSMASVYNRYALPRVWDLNGLDYDLMPRYEPDMVSRVDLQQLGGFVANLATAQIDMSDPEIENYLRIQAGMPQMGDDELDRRKDERDASQALQIRPGDTAGAADQTAQAIMNIVAREMLRGSKQKRPQAVRTNEPPRTKPARSKPARAATPPQRAAA